MGNLVKSPGTAVELPYRWRRFPIEEEPVFQGASSGPRHPNGEVIGESLDTMVRQAREYESWLEGRLVQEEASSTPIHGFDQALRTQVERVGQLIEILDTSTLDQYRGVMNSIATLELRARGKFV